MITDTYANMYQTNVDLFYLGGAHDVPNKQQEKALAVVVLWP